MPSGYRRVILRSATNLDQPEIQLEVPKLPSVSVMLMLQLHKSLKTIQEQADGNKTASTEASGTLTVEPVDNATTSAVGGSAATNATAMAAGTGGKR